MSENIRLAQGPAKPATMADLIKDAEGITKPNLHRRINSDLDYSFEDCDLLTAEDEVLATAEDEDIVSSVAIPVEGDAEYALTVQAVNSYRTTSRVLHDEESTTEEIP